MANRYWGGGAGTWSTTDTTHWYSDAGLTTLAGAVPTAADSVFFQQAATYTVTMTGALNCLDITVSAGVVTFATGTTPTLSVSGSMSLVAGTVWSSTGRSEEHTSELQSRFGISYAVFCLKKNKY